jgi:hypothetical protein
MLPHDPRDRQVDELGPRLAVEHLAVTDAAERPA